MNQCSFKYCKNKDEMFRTWYKLYEIIYCEENRKIYCNVPGYPRPELREITHEQARQYLDLKLEPYKVNPIYKFEIDGKTYFGSKSSETKAEPFYIKCDLPLIDIPTVGNYLPLENGKVKINSRYALVDTGFYPSFSTFNVIGFNNKENTIDDDMLI